MVTQPDIKTVRDLKGKIIGITPGRDAACKGRQVAARQWNGCQQRRYVFIGGRRRSGEPGCGSIERRHSCHHVYSALDLISESGHENPHQIDVANVGGG